MCAVVDGIRYLGSERCLYLGFKPSKSLTDNQYQIHFEKRPTIPFLFAFTEFSCYNSQVMYIKRNFKVFNYKGMF